MNVRIKSTPKDSIKPFSQHQLTRIREAVETWESPEDQLLFAMMLAGMRASECISIKVGDLDINDAGLVTVEGVSIPFMGTPSTIEFIKRESLSKEGYVFMCFDDSSTRLCVSVLHKRFRQWLKNANVDDEGATPHLLRFSMLSAYETAQKNESLG